MTQGFDSKNPLGYFYSKNSRRVVFTKKTVGLLTFQKTIDLNLSKKPLGGVLYSINVYLFWDFSDTSSGYVLGEDIRENPYRSSLRSKGLHLENKFKALGFLGFSVLRFTQSDKKPCLPTLSTNLKGLSMYDRIDVYIKAPCHNWRGYHWVFLESTRMSKTLKQAKNRFCEVNEVHPDSVKTRKGE